MKKYLIQIDNFMLNIVGRIMDSDMLYVSFIKMLKPVIYYLILEVSIKLGKAAKLKVENIYWKL